MAKALLTLDPKAEPVGPLSRLDEDRQDVRTASVLLPLPTSGNHRLKESV